MRQNFKHLKKLLDLKQNEVNAEDEVKHKQNKLSTIKDWTVIVGMMTAILTLLAFTFSIVEELYQAKVNWDESTETNTLCKTYVELGEGYYKRRRFGKAAKYFKLALIEKPNEKLYRINLLKARTDSIFEKTQFKPLYNVGRNIEAVTDECRLLRNLVTNHRHLSEISRIEAVLAWMNYDFKKVQNRLEESEKLWKNNHAALVNHGILLYFLGDDINGAEKFHEALACVKKEEKGDQEKMLTAFINEEWGLSLLKRGISGFNDDYFRLAKEKLIAAVKNSPNNPIYNANLGEVYFRLNQRANAEVCFSKAEEIDPSEAYVNFLKAMMLFNAGEYREAEIQFKIAHNKNPNDAMIQSSWGYAMFLMRKDNIAYLQFRKILRNDLQNAYVMNDFALGLMECMQIDSALHKYHTIINDLNYKKDKVIYWNYARALYLKGAYDKAEKMMNHAVKIDPTPQDSYLQWGLLLKEFGKFGDAIINFEKSDSIFRQNRKNAKNSDSVRVKNSSSLLANLGYSLYMMDNIKTAEKIFGEAIQADPTPWDSYLLWGEALSAIGRYKSATQKYHLADSVFPNNPVVLTNWGYAFYQLDENNRAAKKFEKAIDFDQTPWDTYLSWGYALSNKGNYKNAIKKYQLAASCFPNHPAVFSNWGYAFYQLGKKKDAEQKFQAAVKHDPTPWDTYLSWGNALSSKGRYWDALKKYELADADYPNQHIILANWGKTLYQVGKERKAAEKFEKAVKFDQTPWDTYLMWGKILSKSGQHKEAIKKYQLAASNYPNHPTVLANWGNTLYQVGKTEEAEEKFEAAVKLDLNPWNIYLNWGKALSNKNRFDDANAKYEKAASEDSSNWQIYFRWGESLTKSGKYSEAIRKYQKAYQYAGDQPGLFDSWGYTLVLSGDEIDAEKKFVKAINLKSVNLSKYKTYIVWGDAFLKYVEQLSDSSDSFVMDQIIKAKYKYLNAYSLNPNDPCRLATVALIYYKLANIDSTLFFAEELIKTKNFEQSFKIYQMVAQDSSKISPENLYQLYLSWGKSLLEFEDTNHAKEKFKKASSYTSPRLSLSLKRG